MIRIVEDPLLENSKEFGWILRQAAFRPVLMRTVGLCRRPEDVHFHRDRLFSCRDGAQHSGIELVTVRQDGNFVIRDKRNTGAPITVGRNWSE